MTGFWEFVLWKRCKPLNCAAVSSLHFACLNKLSMLQTCNPWHLEVTSPRPLYGYMPKLGLPKPSSISSCLIIWFSVFHESCFSQRPQKLRETPWKLPKNSTYPSESTSRYHIISKIFWSIQQLPILWPKSHDHRFSHDFPTFSQHFPRFSGPPPVLPRSRRALTWRAARPAPGEAQCDWTTSKRCQSWRAASGEGSTWRRLVESWWVNNWLILVNNQLIWCNYVDKYWLKS